jgi:hypothetical protein
MNKPRWDALVEELQDPDPKVRRRACEQLAATRDPAVIPFLRNAYLQEDDERVRRAASQGLAAFKAIQAGQAGRGLPFTSEQLRRILLGLAVILGISLLLNGVVAVVGALGDGADEPNPAPERTTPSEREALVAQLQEAFDHAREDANNLRAEIGHHNNSGEINCAAHYHRPPQIALAAIDRQTYRDLAVVETNLNLAMFQLQQPQIIWDHICQSQTTSLTDGLSALSTLDQVDGQLVQVDMLLQKAIREPAPTYGPSVTPLPTQTFTPEPSETLAPTTPTITAPASATALPTATPQPADTPTHTPTATRTPLPFPEVDYIIITREIVQRFAVMGDLQNTYGTGMIDRWRQAQAGEALSTTFCTFAAWPQPYQLPADQQTKLQQPGVADPELEQALSLTQEGLALAVQARALYEPSCQSGTLADTADQGIGVAQDAFDKLSQAQTLIEAIRRRK